MEEKNVIKFKKNEFNIKECIRKELGKGKISKVRTEYTPIGEKIIVSTNKPGLIIGRRGERIEELTNILKTKFKLENPRIEIEEILKPDLDAQLIADEIALGLERAGPLKFKVIAYRTLQRILNSGALGVEIILSGKLPGQRAKCWRFAQGYLKKTGDDSKLVDRAKSVAQTKPGIVGIKVSILSPDVIFKDQIIINDEIIANLKQASDLIENKSETNKK
jgi:small subunit ribosomal protein S3